MGCTYNKPTIPVNNGMQRTLSIKRSDFIKENKGEFRTFYKVGPQMGCGAFGEVRKCKYKATGEMRAVKIILKHMLEYKQQYDMVSEIEILRQLDHPNIVRIYEFFQDDKRYYIVTELLTGGELFEKIIHNQIYGELNAARYMRQIISAVSYCHNMHIVHRDIKPENILFESRDESSPIKIIDFGTSQFFQTDKKMKSKQGSAYYIAPEVLKKNYNEKCDVWSCGIILYLLLVGKPPFFGKEEKEIIDQVQNGRIDYNISELQNISLEAKTLLKSMTEYSPHKRCSSLQALNHPWFSKMQQSSNIECIPNILQNLKSFRATAKMEQAVFMYITTHMVTNQEKNKLREVFENMDTNHDGHLSREELVEGYSKLTGNHQEAEAIVNDIMSSADPDGNGVIDYSEFLVATTNKKNLLSEEKLKATFDMFDQDGSGFITPEEVKCILGFGKMISETAWSEVVRQVDVNGDGKISYDEFKKMMLKFMEEA